MSLQVSQSPLKHATNPQTPEPAGATVPLMSCSPNDEMLQDLIETDRKFFSAGAHNHPIGPAVVSFVPEAIDLAAGCVIHSVDATQIEHPRSWVTQVESVVKDLGASLVRIYLGDHLNEERHLCEELIRGGYTPRREQAFVLTNAPEPPRPGVSFLPMDPSDDQMWVRANEVHRVGGIGSGIYAAPSDKWTALMRTRCAHEDMDAFLVTLNGEACGTVATLRAGGLLRSKNVLVDKRFRRHDIGRSVLSLLWTMAMGEGLSCIGAFAAATTPGTHLYRGAGFSEVGGQVEYSLTR